MGLYLGGRGGGVMSRMLFLIIGRWAVTWERRGGGGELIARGVSNVGVYGLKWPKLIHNLSRAKWFM